MSLRMLWALLLLVAGAITVAAFGTAHRSYLRLCSMQLDPLDLNRFAPISVRPGEKVTVFFGDSRAAHWATPKFRSRTFLVNHGISGQTTAQVLGRFDLHVAPLRPAVVVIQAGSNDLKCIPLFPERAAEIEKNCLENLRQIVARCVDSGATVILTTIFPHGRIPLHRRPFFDSRVTEATKRVNEELKRLADSRVIVMDTWPILAGPDGLVRPEFERDLLHLNPAGYEALNARLEDALSARGHRL